MLNALTLFLPLLSMANVWPQEDGGYPDMPEQPGPVLEIAEAKAQDAAQMKPYVDRILGSAVSFRMQPIAGGDFLMGSPATEVGRKSDEGPQRSVSIAPFWMGACEVTWDEYEVFMLKRDQLKRTGNQGEEAPKSNPQDPWADAVSRPTPPYVPMDFNMGIEGYPAISMTQFAAKQYTKWLSMKTGRFYRLATEAEWEYACRAGSQAAYAFGEDAEALAEHAWFYANSDDAYHPVGQKLPNAWGLFDMHGNVGEWVLDGYSAESYATKSTVDLGSPELLLRWPTKEYPRVVRGGSWDDDPELLRSATRRASSSSWKMQDPQLPKSIWYLTNAQTVGFRIVRPLAVPSMEERGKYWDADLRKVERLQERQRRGQR